MEEYLIIVAIVFLIASVLLKKLNDIQIKINKQQEYIFEDSKELMSKDVSYRKYKNIARKSSPLNRPFRDSGSFLDFISDSELQEKSNLVECNLREVFCEDLIDD